MAAILAVPAFNNEPQSFEASPSELIWPLFNDQPNQSGSGEEYIEKMPTGLDPLLGTGMQMHIYGSKHMLRHRLRLCLYTGLKPMGLDPYLDTG